MTVHGSKGLEFPVVFLCDLEESIFPNYRRKAGARIRTWADAFRKIVLRNNVPLDCDIDEEKRLFYVGVTRAEHFLYLVSCRKKHHNGRRISFEPSLILSYRQLSYFKASLAPWSGSTQRSCIP